MNRTGVAVIVVIGSLQALNGATVYQQPSAWSGNGTDVVSTWTSQTDPGFNGFRTEDNFTLAGSATITQASWRGLYVNSSDLTNAAPNTTDWLIRFQADSGGIPGAVLSSDTILAGLAGVQVLGSGLYNGNTVTVYEFTANLTPFNAMAGVTYWFSPLSRGPSFSPLFTWIQGAGGDGNSFQTAFTAGVVTNGFVRGGDRAFTLSGTPEPGPVLLTGVGLLGLALARSMRWEKGW